MSTLHVYSKNPPCSEGGAVTVWLGGGEVGRLIVYAECERTQHAQCTVGHCNCKHISTECRAS